MSITVIKEQRLCSHKLPCGYCDLLNKYCDLPQDSITWPSQPMPISIPAPNQYKIEIGDNPDYEPKIWC